MTARTTSQVTSRLPPRAGNQSPRARTKSGYAGAVNRTTSHCATAHTRKLGSRAISTKNRKKGKHLDGVIVLRACADIGDPACGLPEHQRVSGAPTVARADVSYVTNLVRPPLRGPAESGSGHRARVISARFQMNHVCPSNQASIRSPSVLQQVNEDESSTPGVAPGLPVAMVIQSSEQFSVHLLPVIVNGDEPCCRHQHE